MTDTTTQDIARWYEYMKFRTSDGRIPKHLWPTHPATDGRLKAMAKLYIREQDPIDPIRTQILKEICQSLECLKPDDRKRFDVILNEQILKRNLS